MRPVAVSFDLGQTLVELDEAFLLEQARRRGLWFDLTLVPKVQALAWEAYNAGKAEGKTGYDAWAVFVRALLARVNLCFFEDLVPVDAVQREAFIRYLWAEQPHNNLWRRPVPGMHGLIRRLATQGTRLGILTNSEGRARELVDAAGFGCLISVVVDSGVEGIEKPDPRIFARLAERLGCAPPEIVHVGDSYEADVLGALASGMKPVWFRTDTTARLPPGVLGCRNVQELEALLLIR